MVKFSPPRDPLAHAKKINEVVTIDLDHFVDAKIELNSDMHGVAILTVIYRLRPKDVDKLLGVNDDGE